MSFQGKYEILSTLSEGEAKSYRAKKIPSGRPVILHHLAANRATTLQPDLASLVFEFLRTASKEASRNFLDMGDEEGRIFIVTADVPECQDLRKWLQTGIGEPADKNSEPESAAGAAPDPRNIQLTRNFTTDALRQLARTAMGDPAPTSPTPRAAMRTATAVETNPGEKIVVPKNPAEHVSPEQRPTILFPVSEETSPDGIAGFSDAPSALKESLAAGMTAEFPSERRAAGGKSPGSDPGSALPSKTAQVQPPIDLEATSAGTNSTLPLNSAPLISTGAQGKPLPQISKLLADAAGPPQKTVMLSTQGEERKEVDLRPPENPAPRKLSMGFEMVFQSDKPRSHPTLSGAADPDIMGTSFGPPTEREELAPTPTVPGEPLEGLPAGPPPAGPRKPTGTMFDMPVSQPPSRAWQAPLELEKGTRPSAAPGPGEYTRMMENVKSLAGPLAPESPPSGGRSGSGAASGQGAYLQMPSSSPPSYRDSTRRAQAAQYHPHDGDSLPPRQKRKVWVPIVILGSLFVMTVALLVFYALK